MQWIPAKSIIWVSALWYLIIFRFSTSQVPALTLATFRPFDRILKILLLFPMPIKNNYFFITKSYSFCCLYSEYFFYGGVLMEPWNLLRLEKAVLLFTYFSSAPWFDYLLPHLSFLPHFFPNLSIIPGATKNTFFRDNFLLQTSKFKHSITCSVLSTPSNTQIFLYHNNQRYY